MFEFLWIAFFYVVLLFVNWWRHCFPKKNTISDPHFQKLRPFGSCLVVSCDVGSKRMFNHENT